MRHTPIEPLLASLTRFLRLPAAAAANGTFTALIRSALTKRWRGRWLRISDVNYFGRPESLSSDNYEIDDDAWAAAERLDGKLLLVTSLGDGEAAEIVERYRSLADIERGFRALKGTLDIAPVHHRLPERIRAHALICFLALVVYRVLRMRLRANPPSGVHSVERLLETLETVQLHRLTLDGEPIQGISMDFAQRDLFKSLEVTPPRRDIAV